MKPNCDTANMMNTSASRNSICSQRCRRSGVLLVLALALLLAATAARAGSLADVFSSGELAGLQMEPLGDAFANTVASTYPVASASSSVTYVYNPKLEAFERQAGVLGPIVGERAETIGQGQLNVGFSFSWVDLSTINGDNLGNLENRARIGSQTVSFPVPGGAQRCGDPRLNPDCSFEKSLFTSFLPVHVFANIDVEAEIGTPSITYGVTPDLDVNLTVPLMKTSLGVRIAEDVPDPRLPDFKLRICKPDAPEGDPSRCAPDEKPSSVTPGRINRAAFARATGFGDVLLRGKYVLLRGAPFDLAAGLGVSFPSGDKDNFQGTGTYRVQPTLIASRVIAERFQPLLNLGVDINADDVGRSIFRWAVGATGQIVGPLSGAVVFLGRNEFSAQSDQIAAPFFFQIERNDMYDASVGVRMLFAESGVVSANVIVPLNRDGLRADYIPTLGVEYAFSAPW